MATCPSCRNHYTDEVASCPRDGSTLVPDAVMAAADTDLPAGEMVGEYRVEEKLGAGGFGAVYRAVHPLIGKTAAVKVLHRQFSSNPQMVSRFIAEAKSVNQIRHKNIIDIFSFGALADGRQYYVMELLEGQTFDRHIKQRGRLPVDEAVPILRQIARALDAAHAAGIVHRDLKPENIILLFDEDGVPTPKLLDFGIAKLLGDSEQGHKTRTGTPMGTPYYMSPEQAHGKVVDHRTDIYSFGVMTHEVLTGRVLFDGESVMDVLVKHIHEPPPRVSEVCPDLPAALDEPVQRMLAKKPADRPSTLAEAVDALMKAAAGSGFNVPLPARPGPVVPPARSSERGAVVVTPSGASSSASTLDSAALAEARTVIGDPPLAGVTGGGASPARSRAWMFGGAGVVAALVVLGLVATLGNDPVPPVVGAASASAIAGDAPPAASSAAALPPTVTPSAPAPAPPEPSAAASTSSAAEPAPSASITVSPAPVPSAPGAGAATGKSAPVKPTASAQPTAPASAKPSSEYQW